MLKKVTARAWDTLRERGCLSRTDDKELFDPIVYEGGLEDIEMLAGAQHLGVVLTDEALWLVADPDSKYLLKPDFTGRSQEKEPGQKECIALICLVVMDAFFLPGYEDGINKRSFILRDDIVSHMDALAARIEALGDRAAPEIVLARNFWVSKRSTNDSRKENMKSKYGVVKGALNLLVGMDIMKRMDNADGSIMRWDPTDRARALWPLFGKSDEFAGRMSEYGFSGSRW